jgi:hypothetical protein
VAPPVSPVNVARAEVGEYGLTEPLSIRRTSMRFLRCLALSEADRAPPRGVAETLLHETAVRESQLWGFGMMVAAGGWVRPHRGDGGDANPAISWECIHGFALVSPGDERIQRLARRHRRFGSYLRRFKTEFGQAVRPSVMIWREDARNVGAIAAFRDAVAMSVIPRGWAYALRWEDNMGIMYSDYFAVHPWMVDKNYDDLVMRTMAVLAVHQVKEFKGQSSPGLTPRPLDVQMVDKPLLQALLSRWEQCFGADKPDESNIKLFRSLNMANFAAHLPAGADVTLYDIGRSVALWASAFEILTPRGVAHVPARLQSSG